MPPVEVKVQAASLAAAVSGAVLWALSVYAFKGSTVPPGLVSLVDLAVPAILAAAAGYMAPHTPRPDLAPRVPLPPTVTMTPPPPATAPAKET
jgi:hypothetical protein